MEPTQLEENVKWHMLERLVPLVENNYNSCELGPRGTGKLHVYKEIFPNIGVRRTNDGGQSFLQYVIQANRSCRHVGYRGF